MLRGEIFGGPISASNYNDSVSADNPFAERITVDYSSIGNSDALNKASITDYKPNKKDSSGYFSPPASGWNWRILHDYNAVDIANRCGTPIYASAEGIVVPDKNLGDGSTGWNDGYGLFVLIEHPNGAETRYAHLERIVSLIGRYVEKGELIGYMGNTGNTHGPTGCHLHFEVIGAENPLAK
ncbi:MAG: ToxR-activated protein [Candidatus Wolfebacteria bacterium GW2011_GWA2_42_10]|uniref:ToxR-activated protein n=2 Tax=Candidatus Wolfeibacteriota TaxID=1752735 RepID=A0A0G1AJ67_9BACT|nr:MAG: ToxR-activated protein [Candidatus Wolfebacteria bacterium GW2011_GWB1_41_12]KKS25338.1 MAG: ToxR-activated protein [Candidatus Wolfebacteria bacterium GW2011_GWA2_42_10]KKT56777.1 MAG: ToxR-activated protein [Candidatus Wolfebacteria bacterium GW2011_GWA1_44_24]